MGFLDLVDDDVGVSLHSQIERDRRSGPCDDDCEVTAPLIDILPEESDHEEGSPLNFDCD